MAAPNKAHLEVATKTLNDKVRSLREEKQLTGGSQDYRLFPLIPFESQQSFETDDVEIDQVQLISKSYKK